MLPEFSKKPVNTLLGFKMSKEIISTTNAPQAIGTYSQAVKVDNTVYISGQIPLVPETMEVVEGDFAENARQVFRNLAAITEAAGGTINDIVKINIFLTDLSNFATVNEVMAEFMSQPYPARAALQISALPKGVEIEADAVMAL
jgi:reactive intermediate/imine deaminase